MANTFGPDTVKLYSNDITFILHHFVQYTRIKEPTTVMDPWVIHLRQEMCICLWGRI